MSSVPNDTATGTSRRQWFGRIAAAALGGLWLTRARRAEALDLPLIGEIRMFAGNFAPVGWAMCDGTFLSIEENTNLFNLIGTMYGGDGQTTFAVPDLRGRAPVHMGSGAGLSTRFIGEIFGDETVTLTPGQLPAHTHANGCNTGNGTSDDPTNRVPAKNAAGAPTYAAAANVDLISDAIIPAGGTGPHANMQPYLAINFIIALEGDFPTP